MNNIYRKIIVSLITIFPFCTAIYSQNTKNHEFSFSVSGGPSYLNSSTNIGNTDGKFGGALGIGYTYFLTDKLGLVSGLEVSLYKSEFKAGQFSNTLSNITDAVDGELFDFYSSVTNYKENQNATYLNIPLQLQYQSDAFGSNKFYALGGVKIGIPVKKKYETKENSFVNKGYFHETGIWGGDNQEFLGFGTFHDRKSKGDINNLRASFSLCAEAGMKWTLAQNVYLYTGLYIDYGLNNIASEKGNFISLEETDTGMNFASNSVLTSTYNDVSVNNKFVDKVSLFAGGIKLKIAFAQ